MIDIVGGTTINGLSPFRRKRLITEMDHIATSDVTVSLNYVPQFDELNIIFGEGKVLDFATCSNLDFLLQRKVGNKTGKLLGLILSNPLKMLKEQGCEEATISMEDLVSRHWSHFPKETWAFMENKDGSLARLDAYKDQILALAIRHRLVWEIPK